MIRANREAFGDDSGVRLRHSLACVGDIRRRVMVNRESVNKVADSMDLPRGQVKGAVRLLRSLPYEPSPERLALVVMRDYGMTDRDIGEIFGRDPRWSRVVRENAELIRREEPIEYGLEFLDDGLHPSDPPPDELLRRAAELRESGIYRKHTQRREPYAFLQASLGRRSRSGTQLG